MSKRIYKINVTLVQKGWVKVKADSLEAALAECDYSVHGTLWPLDEPVGEEFTDYEYDRADVTFTHAKSKKSKKSK